MFGFITRKRRHANGAIPASTLKQGGGACAVTIEVPSSAGAPSPSQSGPGV